MDINGMIKMQTGPKMDKMEVKNEKLPILRPIFHLIDCKSINGQKKWLYKQNNTKHIL
tara:strand:- start:68 stop:241 length:174 start_codon:yes stop_codon:yes gene_type:complete